MQRTAGKRILIVGGGYVGMYTALDLERRLGGTPDRIVLVNPENFMQYQPFLPEVASGLIDPRAVVVPLRRVLRKTEVVVGTVERIDHDGRTARVLLADGQIREEPYDVVVLGAGSRSRVMPIPGLAEHAVGFKTVAEAIWLRNRVVSRLDAADELQDPEARTAALTFVFVGAGFAGIEVLGELEDFARAAMRVYTGLRREDMRWLMIEASPRILPELDHRLAAYAARRLKGRGIEIRTETQITAVDETSVHLSSGESIRIGTLVWTAGVKPSELPRESGLPVDGAGRVKVDRYLRVEGLADAWAGGDVAAVPDPDAPAGLSPPTAQHALRQARCLGANVAAAIAGRPPTRFRYKNKGMLCSLGHYKGVADPFGVRIRGFPAWFLHRSYHLFYMPTIGRKVRIAMDWTVSLLFPRDIAQLGSLEHPREEFRKAAGQ
jgi:NADH:ubiquinone reductase (H+-translocating)